MIIFLSEEHKKHLEILQSHSVPVLVDFCKLSLDFIHNGPNNKRYAIAAQKLNVSEEVIENVVNGLVYLVIECCKQNSDEDWEDKEEQRYKVQRTNILSAQCTYATHAARLTLQLRCQSRPQYEVKLNFLHQIFEKICKRLPASGINVLIVLVICLHSMLLRDGDFRASLSIANFSSEHTDVLLKFYKNKKAEVSAALNRLSSRASSYQDLEWRFEVQIASRADTEVILKPGALLDFVLQTPKPLTDSDENTSLDDATNTTDTSANLNMDSTSDSLDRLRITRGASQATAASQCDNHIEHALVQCDLPNLVNLTSKLDQALAESKSAHVKKMYRNFQKK